MYSEVILIFGNMLLAHVGRNDLSGWIDDCVFVSHWYTNETGD